MEVRQGSILQQSSGGQVSSVEVTGPVLPHNVVGLARLFTHVSHGGNFTATVGGVHDATLSFNCLPQDEVDQPSESLNRQYLLPDDVCHSATLGNQAVRELCCVNGLYTWTC